MGLDFILLSGLGIPIGDHQSIGHRTSTGHMWSGLFRMHRSVPIPMVPSFF